MNESLFYAEAKNQHGRTLASACSDNREIAIARARREGEEYIRKSANPNWKWRVARVQSYDPHDPRNPYFPRKAHQGTALCDDPECLTCREVTGK